MSAALKTADISPEALAFVSRGTPKPVFSSPTPQEPTPQPEAVASTQARQTLADADAVAPRSRPAAAKATPVASGAVVGLSFRLPLEIHNALMRASFERKMEKQEPWTQQDIAAEAFTNWLKKQGYL